MRNTKGIMLIEVGIGLCILGVVLIGFVKMLSHAEEQQNMLLSQSALEPVPVVNVDRQLDGRELGAGVGRIDLTAASGLATWDIDGDLPRDGATERSLGLSGGAIGYLEFGDTDAYWLDMPERGDVLITLEGVEHGVGAAGDPDIAIHTASGEIVERGSSDGGERLAASLDAGRYLVSAKLYGSQTGHYEMRITPVGGQ